MHYFLNKRYALTICAHNLSKWDIDIFIVKLIVDAIMSVVVNIIFNVYPHAIVNYVAHAIANTILLCYY